MSNLTMIWNNQSDSASVSGGNWLTTLPKTNVQNRLLTIVARSIGVATSATQMDLDLGPGSNVYSAICILSHNLSVNATVRVTADPVAGFPAPVFDSGWVDAYAYVVPMSERLWEMPNWWDGKPTEDDLEGYSLNTLIYTDVLTTARYIRVEVDDTTNVNNYIDIGRIIVAPMTELAINTDYGATLSWTDRSEIGESIGGSEFFDSRLKKREFTCAGSNMFDDEALGTIFEIQKQQGITGEIFIVPDQSDTKHGFRRSFLARMTARHP